MDIWKCQVVVVVLFTLVYTYQGMSFSLDKARWISKDWQDEPVDERLATQVANLIKRSKSQQFYGLMGKRSDVEPRIRMNRIRNKGEMFVGLMGRRALNGESFSRIIPGVTSTALGGGSEESHTQQDSQEEWDKLQYY